MAVHISRIRQLRHRCTIDEMDFAEGERAQGRHAEFFGQGVDARVFEELVPCGVHFGDGGVRLESPARGELVREVFARVEVFEHGGGGGEIVVGEGDGGGGGGGDGGGEEGGVFEEELVGAQGGGGGGGADGEGYDGGFEVAVTIVD